MDETKKIGIATVEDETENDALLIFGKPYKFEDHTYTQIDLSGLENLTAEDMIAAEKYLTRTGIYSPIPEMSIQYVCQIASRVTDQPIEFFQHLPPKEVIKLKNKVTGFFYGAD